MFGGFFFFESMMDQRFDAALSFDAAPFFAQPLRGVDALRLGDLSAVPTASPVPASMAAPEPPATVSMLEIVDVDVPPTLFEDARNAFESLTQAAIDETRVVYDRAEDLFDRVSISPFEMFAFPSPAPDADWFF